jgi:hypothetical protein
MFFLLLLFYSSEASLNISIDTKWKTYTSSSLIQEISEYYSETGEFWNFLDQNLSLPLDALLPSLFSSPLQQDLLLTSLHNREFASRLEFYSQLERLEQSPCRPFYVINSKQSCSLDEALTAFPVILENSFDHFFRFGVGHLVFYADITSPEFKENHRKCQEFAERFNLTYALRHIDRRRIGIDMVGGFGAELIMKNMEYNPTEDLNLNYVPLEKWDIQAISRKALTHLLTQDSLKEISEILSNIPDHVESIISTQISKSVSRELDKLAYSQTPLRNTLLINNQEIQADIFESLKVLRSEMRAVQNLESLNLSSSEASEIQTFANFHLRSFQTRSKIIKTPITTGRLYLNDLELDRRYFDLPHSPESFFMSYSQNIPPVALNLLNVILVSDLNTLEGFKSLKNMIKLVDLVPFHFGVIITGDLNYSTLVLEGLRTLKKVEEDLPFEFLEMLEFGMSESQVLKLLNTLCPECEFDVENSSLGKRCEKFCLNVGLCGPAQVIVNGRVLDLPDVDLSYFETLKENLLYELMKEKRTVTALAMRGYLEQPLEAFFEKVKYTNTTERVNLAISSVPTAKIKVVRKLPKTAFGWESKKPQGFVYVVLKESDLELARIALDFYDRASDLGLQFKFLLNMNSLPPDLASELSRIANFPSNIENSLLEMQTEITSLGLCDSCIIVNSRELNKSLFLNYRDFYIALETESSRLNIPELSKLLPKATNLEHLIHTLLNNLQYSKSLQAYRAPPIPSSLKSSPLTRVFNSKSLFEVSALIDIDSSEAVKIISICSYLHDLGGRVTLTLASLSGDSKFPIRTYYKYLIKSDFDSQLRMIFNQTHTYSLNIDSLDSWIVRPMKNSKDLDNLFIKDEETILFSIKSILVQGQCAQTLHGMNLEPPNGLQLTLTSAGMPVAETIVMKNFGYFQFQAFPGSFEIDLAQGRSSEIFDIVKGQAVHVKDINGEVSLMTVSKKIGFEKEEVLEVQKSSRVEYGDTIHVFSLASGKLYERLIKIMMTSVMKFTKNKVKFWLLEDFFSPNFSEGIENLAKKLGFEYELLSYKWPSWLYRQTEKQRIIWGYKILFLDVLFPLSVNRVIYIDADQVVRADIKELWEMDLEGAPYAYVPFCDSNPLTEKFMFWKGGYWKNHLKELPYHISALYIVDLFTFRNLGAGDILRYFYETLAPSPDSLSNLDQDLPNFAQTHLKIFSLPQEWLWCASWCSAESQEQAKSIDLCNNPLTREHKIEAAKKYIPEWKDYDEFVSKVSK